jgi:hypothetical protein
MLYVQTDCGFTAACLLDLAIRYPEADTIHLVLDNLSSHTRKAVVQRFGEKAGGWLWDRFTVHYTPKHGSLAEPSRDRHQPVFPAMSWSAPDRRLDLSAERNQAWSRRMNRHRIPIQWRFTRKKARRVFDYTITRSRYYCGSHNIVTFLGFHAIVREWETLQEYRETLPRWSSDVCELPGCWKRECISPK